MGSGISPHKTMNKYTRDKQRMDEIAERLSQRQDIWQDRYIYWMAVAIGHMLEWMVKHEKEHRGVVKL